MTYVPPEYQCHSCGKSPYGCKCEDETYGDEIQLDYEG
jgi:hypothetical protein